MTRSELRGAARGLPGGLLPTDPEGWLPADRSPTACVLPLVSWGQTLGHEAVLSPLVSPLDLGVVLSQADWEGNDLRLSGPALVCSFAVKC